ncbi:hypothetical protein A2625_07615 [candidate division WOR-1 bacterium RIFCSPHIGHO2_01_FULL_53_15]|uniref:Uncharacterized protein n=1 Tax=candidate division WOR-1 bacterium RIFCSPHIGHO2_01_FULL_53_15 TaxID=1802564 RepID=A0A1F4Q4U5_UNCSA|nr:MAG: hypothetical protein A2625_07615 [candidate division WOR-1 bacterium RIFCSPHIGHO2_01_FULL_53_15]OGC10559.1 MAG: hypothetical protein A3D23_01550 [candidate division WOR-1 bacterium RIFCSPHIGHO2_02_FULL_53_26]
MVSAVSNTNGAPNSQRLNFAAADAPRQDIEKYRRGFTRLLARLQEPKPLTKPEQEQLAADYAALTKGLMREINDFTGNKYSQEFGEAVHLGVKLSGLIVGRLDQVEDRQLQSVVADDIAAFVISAKHYAAGKLPDQMDQLTLLAAQLLQKCRELGIKLSPEREAQLNQIAEMSGREPAEATAGGAHGVDYSSLREIFGRTDPNEIIDRINEETRELERQLAEDTNKKAVERRLMAGKAEDKKNDERAVARKRENDKQLLATALNTNKADLHTDADIFASIDREASIILQELELKRLKQTDNNIV